MSLCGVLWALGVPARAVERVANSGDTSFTSFWNLPGIWSPVGEPQAGDDISIGDVTGGVLVEIFPNIPILYVTALPDPTIYGTLKVNASLVGGSTNQFNPMTQPTIMHDPTLFLSRGIHQAGLTLRTTNEIFGDDKTGYFLQTGGLHTVEEDAILGRHSSGIGLYAINAPIDGVYRVRRDLVVGDAGIGALQQAGGQIIVQRDLWFGKSAGGQGVGLISGPLEVWGNTIVGGAGHGNVLLGVGLPVATIGGNLTLGLSSTGHGELEMAPLGRLEVAGDVTIGDAGTGELRTSLSGPSAPRLMVGGDMVVGRQEGATGSISGIYSSVGGDLVLGDEGSGSANWTSDAGANVQGSLILGRENSGRGTVSLGHDSLLFANSAEVSVAGDLVIGKAGEGAYQVFTGTTSVQGNVSLGYETAASGAMTLGMHGLPTAPVTHIGGDLVVGEQGHGELTVSGLSTVTVGDGLIIGRATTATGTVRLEDFANLQAGDVHVGESGNGSLQVGEASRLSVAGDLQVGSGHQASGGVTVADQAELSVAGQTWIGRTGSGTWNQSGGSTLFSGAVTLGDDAGGVGLMNVSGGTLSAGDFSVLKTGTLNLSGGNVNLASLSLSGGKVDNTGGTLLVGDLFLGGGSLKGDIKTTGTITIDPIVSGLDGHVENGGYFELDQLFEPLGGFSNSGLTRIVQDGHLRTDETKVLGGTVAVESGGMIEGLAVRNHGGIFRMESGSQVDAEIFEHAGGLTRIEGGHLSIESGLTVHNGEFWVLDGVNLDVRNYYVGQGGVLNLTPHVITQFADATLDVRESGRVSINTDEFSTLRYLPKTTRVIGGDEGTPELTGSGAWHLVDGAEMLVSRAKLTGTGTLTVESGAELEIRGAGSTIAQDIDNHGLTRLNAAVVPTFFMEGESTLTNYAGGTLRVLDDPYLGGDYAYNSLRATGLHVINAGTMTIGALTPQTGQAELSWFWLNQSFSNTGTLSLLNRATFSVEGQFLNTGAITLANDSGLTAYGGGVFHGTLQLGSHADSFAVFRGAEVHDTGTTFSGAGFVSMEGGTLHTGGGEYMSAVNLELLDNVVLSGATGLAVGDGRWLRVAGSVPGADIRVTEGGTLELMGGTNTSAITVEAGGRARLGETYHNPTHHVRPVEDNVLNHIEGQAGSGEIHNHGLVEVVSGRLAGTGLLHNHAGGTVEAVTSGYQSNAHEMLLDTVNEGSLLLWARDEYPVATEYQGSVRFGDILNSGVATLRATEATADGFDDVFVQVGHYRQTAGSTVIEGGLPAAGSTSPSIRADSMEFLGGTVVASGRLIAPTVSNAADFKVAPGGLGLTGTFTNQNGGNLWLDDTLWVSGSFVQAAGSRVVLDGTSAGVVAGGNHVFGGSFSVLTGTTVELRNRTLNGAGVHNVSGLLVIGEGASMHRWDGRLDGTGEVRIAAGGSAVFSDGFNASGPGLLNIEEGASLQLNNGYHRFYGRTLTNSGTVNHVGNSLYMGAGTTLTNHGTWTVNLPGTGSVGGYTTEGGQPAGGMFVNHGTFNKDGANTIGFGSYNTGPGFTNHGTLNVNAGTLGLHAQANFGSTSVANIAAGAVLLVRDGTSVTESGARFQGPGTVSFGDGGKHTMTGDIHADNAVFWGGSLHGTHTLHGQWKVQDGANMGTAGTTTLAEGSSLELAHGYHRLYNRTLVNEGTVTHTGSSVYLNSNSVITNHGTWTVSLPGTGSVGGYTTEGGQPAGGMFVNHGTFNKDGANTIGFGSYNTGPGFTNHGTLNVNAGTLGLYAQADFSGTSVANIAAGATLLLRDGTATMASGARFQGAGTLAMGDGGNFTLTGDIHADNAWHWGGTLRGTHTLHGNWETGYNASMATAGTTTVAADGRFVMREGGEHRLQNRTFVNEGEVSHTAGHVRLNASTTIVNAGTWVESSGANFIGSGHKAGAIVNTGTFVKTGNNTVSVDLYDGPSFSNLGTVDVQQGTLQLNRSLVQRAGTTLTDGTWIVRNGATLAANRDDAGNYISFTNNQADLTLHGTGYFAGIEGLTQNQGTLRLLDGKTFGTTAAFANSGHLAVGEGSSFATSGSFDNSGTLNVNGSFSAGVLNNTGTLGGSGQILANAISNGLLTPGNSPGLLEFMGDLTLGSQSLLVMELGGLERGLTYDHLWVGGTLTFGGDLNVMFLDDFSPLMGMSFDLFDASVFSGAYNSIILPTLTQGLHWNVASLYTTGQISIDYVLPPDGGGRVPDTASTAALFGLGMLGMLWGHRRQRRSGKPGCAPAAG